MIENHSVKNLCTVQVPKQKYGSSITKEKSIHALLGRQSATPWKNN